MASAAAGSTSSSATGIVPAQLGFLAIFNPSLGNTDDTIDDQIVYYASDTTQGHHGKRRRRRSQKARPTEAISQEERHERLRQIGLAQGMINFSRDFAEGASLDSVDTEKSRVVTHELEAGWWILASINFTKVPLPPRLATKSSEPQEEKFEYSSRELKPASLLVRDLLRAHSIFLMHHDTSLSAQFVRCRRTKFVAVLSRYWDLFLSTWSVMLQGNPARNIFGGINIAASGELGVGVGEEERGSGEREVLEGLVGRIEGLVDLVVSKFGTDVASPDSKDVEKPYPPSWLGTGQEPAAEDGAIFLGVGALSRRSLRDVTHWMEDLYQWGDHAYGIIESPTSTRRARARRRSNKSADEPPKVGDVAAATGSSSKAAAQAVADSPPTTTAETASGEQEETKQQEGQAKPDVPVAETKDQAEDGKFDKMLSYMKLGYGSYWTLPGQAGNQTVQPSGDTGTGDEATGSTSQAKAKPKETTSAPLQPAAVPSRPKLTHTGSSTEAAGHYLIGLKGDIEEQFEDPSTYESDESEAEHNSRTVLRTINVELHANRDNKPDYTVIQDLGHPSSDAAQSRDAENMFPGYDSHDVNQAEKLRVVVYVNRPFMFVFLFRLRTDSLAWDGLYRSLHYQLAPLKKPLLASTSYRPETPESSGSGKAPSAASTIYNLVWDPTALTVRSSIPNIPDLQYLSSSSSGDELAWSRADAVSTHLHLLNIHASTRSRSSDVERTQKTNRGWWIVWTRLVERLDDTATHHNLTSSIHESSVAGSGIPSPLPPSPTVLTTAGSDEEEGNRRKQEHLQRVMKEIFLIRRASDHAGFRSISVGEGSVAEGASKLVQGIGVDTRRYVEELLSFL